jgi:hypothetical protein
MLCTCIGGAFAQARTAPSAADPGTLGTRPEHGVTASGIVQRFTRSPTGAVDGFVLDSGMMVHFPGYLSRQVTGLVAENARVRVNGILVTGTDPGAVQLLEARTITELDRNVTLTVTGTGASQPGSTVSGDEAGGTAGSEDAGAAGGGAAGAAGTGR